VNTATYRTLSENFSNRRVCNAAFEGRGGTVQISEAFRRRHALLSQEGSAARRVARGEVPEPNLVGVPLWNLLSRDLDCVSITLSLYLKNAPKQARRQPDVVPGGRRARGGNLSIRNRPRAIEGVDSG
jgi:hypothetical protein